MGAFKKPYELARAAYASASGYPRERGLSLDELLVRYFSFLGSSMKRSKGQGEKTDRNGEIPRGGGWKGGKTYKIRIANIEAHIVAPV